MIHELADQTSPPGDLDTVSTNQLSPTCKHLLDASVYQNVHDCSLNDERETTSHSVVIVTDSKPKTFDSIVTSPKGMFAKANRLRKSLPARMKRKESKIAAARAAEKTSLLDDIVSETSSPEVTDCTSLRTLAHALIRTARTVRWVALHVTVHARSLIVHLGALHFVY